MRIIIVGAGSVGSQLAAQLSQENHDVTVIEQDHDRMTKLQDELDILVVEGNGASPKVLVEAGIENCDMMMALTNVDEINMVASLSASQYEVPFKIARVSNMDYYLLDDWLGEQNLGVDLLVNPEFECALQIKNLMEVPGASDVAEFGGGQALLVGLTVQENAPCVGEPLHEVKLRLERHDFLVGSVTREGRTIIPTGATRLETGDQVFLICLRDHLEEAYKFCGSRREPISRVMVLGGSKVAVYVCKMLERMKIRTTLIETNEQRAEELAVELHKTLVVHGEPTSVDLWEMEGLDDVGAFLSLTRDDEENLLSGLIAKNHRVPVVIALLEKLNYVPLVNKVGVNTAVSSRLAIVDTILKYVRRGNILSVATLKGNEAELVEFIISPGSKLLRKPLKDLSLPRGVLFGTVSRGKEIFIPTGYTQFQENDRVVLIAGPGAKRYLEKLFA